jgi:hypothetical protein
MKPIPKVILASLLVLLLILFSACSIEIDQTQSIPTETSVTPLSVTLTETVAPTETPSTIVPKLTNPGKPTITPPLSPIPTSVFAFQPVASPELAIEVSPSFVDLKLGGRLLFLSFLPRGYALVTFDLSDGELATLFVTPLSTYITSQSVSPDISQILISYAPEPPPGKSQYQDLYLLTPDQPGSPQPFVLRTEDFEAFFNAFFSPGGDYVYYTHFFEDKGVASGFRYFINRIAYPEGTPEVVVEDAFWQRLSPDGTKLAYVTFDPNGSFFNELYVANPDGSEPMRALDPNEFPIVDAPFFSPDNQYVYFSAIIDQPPPFAWWEKLMGVQAAQAHSVPSDFFRVSLTDGRTTQITNFLDTGLYGTFSPDGKYIAFISATGLYMMRPDGSGFMQVLSSYTLSGSLEWIP